MSGLGQTVGDLCLFDHYTEAPTWNINIESERAGSRECPQTTFTVLKSTWTLYRALKDENFEILNDNIVATQNVNDAVYKIENFNYHGVFAATVLVDYKNSEDVSGRSNLTVSHRSNSLSS